MSASRPAASTRRRPAAWAGVVTAALATVLATPPARAQDSMDADPQVARIDVCFDFGCASHKRIYLFESDWRKVAGPLRGARSPEDERRRIARAIGAMERLVGEVSPTGADRGGNGYTGTDPRGQMDCIDESTNTTTYLRLFQSKGLLAWHRVDERVYRAPLLLDQHWAAQIQETGSGGRFAVDSWPRDNGQPAVVQPLAAWLRSLEPGREAVVVTVSPARVD